MAGGLGVEARKLANRPDEELRGDGIRLQLTDNRDAGRQRVDQDAQLATGERGSPVGLGQQVVDDLPRQMAI